MKRKKIRIFTPGPERRPQTKNQAALELAGPAKRVLQRLIVKVDAAAEKATRQQSASVMSASQRGVEDSYHAQAVAWLDWIEDMGTRAIQEEP